MDSGKNTNSHSLAQKAKTQCFHNDEFYNAEGDTSAFPGCCAVVCKTENPAMPVAVEWLSVHRGECPDTINPYIQERFGLTEIEAGVAIDRARVLRNARAL